MHYDKTCMAFGKHLMKHGLGKRDTGFKWLNNSILQMIHADEVGFRECNLYSPSYDSGGRGQEGLIN